MAEKIALLVDSGVNLPIEIASLPGVYEVPLTIVYNNGTYRDSLEISPKEIYERLDTEQPTTSLPSGQDIHNYLEKIIKDGFNKLIVMTISGNLSGTLNAIKLVAADFPQLTTAFIDTKSAASGSGLQAAFAKELIDKFQDFNTVVPLIQNNVTNSEIYLSLPTLEYLKRGGRIGLVSSLVGSTLNIHPVISCNNEGVIHTVEKARGRKKSLQKMIACGQKFIEDTHTYDIAIVYADCLDDALEFAEIIKETFPNYRKCHITQATPVLGVHTGPDAIGFALLRIT